ncbi:MAG: DUF4870 domain-containing protein, partial [Bacteroidetes bacterium]|nr:DUF4870 domain-containing protein [Bacteroidota bacterium]
KQICEALGVNDNELRTNEKQAHRVILVLLVLSALLHLIHPILAVIAPLCIWLLKKDDIIDVDKTGRQILNFQITWILVFYISFFLISMLMLLGIRKLGQIQSTFVINQIILSSGIKLFLRVVNVTFTILAGIRVYQGKGIPRWPIIPFFKNQGGFRLKWYPILLLVPVIALQIFKYHVPNKYSKDDVTQFCENIFKIPYTPERTYHDTLQKYFHRTIDSTESKRIIHGMFIPYGPQSSVILDQYGRCRKAIGVTHMLKFSIQNHRYLINITESKVSLSISQFTSFKKNDDFIKDVSLKRIKGTKEWWAKTNTGSGILNQKGFKTQSSNLLELLKVSNEIKLQNPF